MSEEELVHPLSRSTYRLDKRDGTVVVTSRGKVGRFTRSGDWIEGETRTADPEMCRWVGGQWLIDRATANDATSRTRST